ncbi:MAG: hypothetical protein Pg6C_05070 [Treponemataceae bacterium]|nr:MAG: hypothetical protein Pg6C_05070 [Treponemataceae bacterium]
MGRSANNFSLGDFGFVQYRAVWFSQILRLPLFFGTSGLFSSEENRLLSYRSFRR